MTRGVARPDRQSPAFLSRLRQALAAGAPAGDDSAQWLDALLDPVLAEEGWIGLLIEDLACSARADPFFIPPFPTFFSGDAAGLLLIAERAVTLALTVMQPPDRQPERISFTGERMRLRVCRASGAVVNLWQLRQPADDAGDGEICRLLVSRPLCGGEVLAVDGRHEAMSIECTDGPLVLLEARIHLERAVVRREFDRHSGRSLTMSATEEASSRTMFLLSLLRTMGRQDAAPLLAQATHAPAFFLRWYAMREFLALDADAALPRLTEMAVADPHPEVRTAARATVTRLAPRAGMDMPCHA